MTPGFHGKIPTAGDFVSRDLPLAFVEAWDRWTARHLAPLLARPGEGHPPLRFTLGPDALGPATGVVLASADRAGRAFPLTLAATVQPPRDLLPDGLEDWFLALEDAGIEALAGETDAEGLARRLAALPLPAEPSESPLDGMIFWTHPGDAVRVEPDEPREALSRLLATAPIETA